MNPVLIKSGIPDIPHRVKRLYLSSLGVFQPGTLLVGSKPKARRAETQTLNNSTEVI